jgi:RND family efflux transporter MFP subunit
VKAHNPTGFLLFWLMVLVLVVSGCEGQGSEQTTGIQNAKSVGIVEVEKTTITEKYEYSGILRASREVKLSSEVSGVITAYLVDKGSRVKEGQLLVSLDEDDYRRKVEEMVARLERSSAISENAQREYERKKSLHTTSVISESALDKEYLNYQTGKADERLSKVLLEQARDDLRKTKIYSPFDGTVLERYREVGELIPSATVLLQVADYSVLELELGLSEKDIVHVRERSEVEVIVDPFPNQMFAGTINYLGVNVESETGTFPVEIIIQNPSLKLFPGIIARAVVSGEVHNGIVLIPQASLNKHFGNPVVFLEKQGRAVRRTVKLGEVFGEKIEIVEGISAGDHLITMGLVDLRDGDPVSTQHKG